MLRVQKISHAHEDLFIQQYDMLGHQRNRISLEPRTAEERID